MKENELKIHAHHMAHATPERSARAARPRERFMVERIWAEGARYLGVSVRVDDGDFLRSHRRPGQYTTFQYGELKPRFLVIASAPSADDKGAAHWEFLIDRGTRIGRQICGENPLVAGRKVILSPAEGTGYPVASMDGNPALLFGTGSGIAALRPVMQYWEARSEGGPSNIALYYGERDPQHFAYVDEISRWRERGVRVYQAVENLDAQMARAGAPGALERGYRYVQHAFEADAPDLDAAAILVSGAPVMMEIVIEKLLRMGVLPERIHINV